MRDIVGSEYGWTDPSATCAHAYLTPAILRLLPLAPARVVDLGSGNGVLAGLLAARGYHVLGVEPSTDGIRQARAANPAVRFEQASVYDDLVGRLGTDFDAVLATEVIEHLYDPRMLIENAFHLLRPGGRALISTPYHGYIKNLAIAIAGGWDAHFTAGWNGGHIKFFSPASLGAMLHEQGFQDVSFAYAGRLPFLWKSMIASCAKPRKIRL